ncbi:MAG: acyl-CoA thioesterase [Fulvivirga sp.]|nr:acyl-CoA thioesterase [Fulvivirga sp.]
MAYTHRIDVSEKDIDQLGHVNNVVYLRYVQETAEAHWKNLASEKMQKETLWVVLRHEIDYKAPAFAGDRLTGKTWVEPYNGPKMPRIVVICNAAGKELVKAKTTWCALDAESQRPKRIDEALYNKFL